MSVLTLKNFSGGVSSFIALTDTDPTTYASQAGKAVEVNAGETGLQFGQKLRATDSPTFASIVVSPVTSGNVLAANGTAFVSLAPDTAGLVDKASVQTISGVKTFSSGLITPKIYPVSDSATAIQINKADGTTNVLNVDTTNGRVGIGTVTPTATFSGKGAGSTSATKSLDIQDSSGNLYIVARNDAKVKIGKSADTSISQTFELAGNINLDAVAEPSVAQLAVMTATLAGAGAGNVDNGLHYYAVAFQTAEGGMTGQIAPVTNVTVVNNTADGKVSLANIPVSTDPRVTARRLYRTTAGGNLYTTNYYLATINDNTTTIYIDNIADSALDTTDYIYRKANTTAGLFYYENVLALQISDTLHTAIGITAGQNNTRGNSWVAIGGAALRSNTTGNNNTAVGYQSIFSGTTGSDSVAIGTYALKGNITGSTNTAIGASALDNGSAQSYSDNTACGAAALFGLNNSNNYNTAIGGNAGYGFRGTGNVHLGYRAGYITPATVGNYNIIIGYTSGSNAASGADKNILIGYDLDLPIANGANQLNIGNFIYGTGLGSGASTLATGDLKIRIAPSSTNTVVDVFKIDRGSTGTPAANMGASALFTLESSTTEEQNAVRLIAETVVATHASRTYRGRVTSFDYAAEREAFRWEADGTQAKIAWFGQAAVARPAALTQTYSTADRTLSAYTPDSESGAYTGIDNAQAGTPYAQLTDLNALRVAYENLRAFTEDGLQFLNALVDDMQAYALEQ